jgi:threonine-phosphate decarboxylase
MIKGHGGNIYDVAQRLGCEPNDIFDMSSNVNPLGPPPGLVSFLIENIHAINALPEVDAKKAIHTFADQNKVNPGKVLAGNGTTQFIYFIPLALETRSALIMGPTYADYADACIMHNVSHSFLIAEDSKEFKPDLEQLYKRIKTFDTVFICNPNNPTGILLPAADLQALCSSYPKVNFVIDESYLPFVADGEKESMVGLDLPNVIVLNSMSKIFRIPGLRIGFIISSERIVEKFVRYSLPWSANSLSQIAVIYLMENKSEVNTFIQETRNFLESEKKYFMKTFKDVPEIQLFPSTTSFVLAKLFENHTAEGISDFLIQSRILIRNCSNFEGLSNRFIRIAFKNRKINSLLGQKLLQFFNR